MNGTTNVEQSEDSQASERLDTLPTSLKPPSVCNESCSQLLNEDIPDEEQVIGPETRFSHNTSRRPHSHEPDSGQQEIVLRRSGLQSLPADFSLRHDFIRVLDLRDNRFTAVPPELMGLTVLHTLRLDNNELHTIPPNICMLSQLEVLTLSNNYIGVIEPNLGKLEQLRILILSGNVIEEWPESVCFGLRNLRVLHLHKNPRLMGIPYAFPQLGRLCEFNLDWYSYLLPPVNCPLRGLQGMRHIHETREACKYSESLAHSRNVAVPKVVHDSLNTRQCTFAEFLGWYVHKEENSLEAFVYPKNRRTLHLAAIWGHVAIMKEILRSDIDVNVRDSEGATALTLAIRAGNEEIAKQLVASGRADLRLPCGKYGTPLHLAIMKDMYRLQELVVSSPGGSMEHVDSVGNTSLHHLFAKFDENPEVATRVGLRLMMACTLDPNQNNNNGMAPLHCAAKKNQTRAIKFAVLYNQQTALDFKRSFDFNRKGGKYGFPLLHYLVLYTDIEIVLHCLQRVSIDILATDCFGRTARELVKNSATGKLLYKLEKAYTRRCLFRHLQRRSCPHSSGRALRLQQRPRKEAEPRSPNQPLLLSELQLEECGLTEEGVSTPVHVKTKAQAPLMFQEFHKLTSKSSRPEQQEQRSRFPPETVFSISVRAHKQKHEAVSRPPVQVQLPPQPQPQPHSQSQQRHQPLPQSTGQLHPYLQMQPQSQVAKVKSKPNSKPNSKPKPKGKAKSLAISTSERKNTALHPVCTKSIEINIVKRLDTLKKANIDLGITSREWPQSRTYDAAEDGNVSDTEGKCSPVQKHPAITATANVRAPVSLLPHCRNTVKNQSIDAKSDSQSSQEITLPLNDLLSSRGNRPDREYRLLYYIYHQANFESQTALLRLCDNLDSSSSLAIDAAYLLASTKLPQALPTFERLLKCQARAALALEAWNGAALLSSKSGTPATAKSLSHKTSLSVGHRQSHLKTPLTGNSGRPLHHDPHSEPRSGPYAARAVQFVPVKKALNYFEETNS